jgi:Ca2+-binding RTX toxin-like protein
VGKSISVTASFTDAKGKAESATSAASTLVLANTTGTTGADTLSGTTGAEWMTGLAGNDTYGVNHAGDVVVEAANAGTDLVQSTVTFTLPTNVENLTLTGTTAINGTGNSLANAITGNAANNVMDGAGGADTLSGAAGDDQYRINVGSGADRIIETTGNDRIVFGPGITAAQLTATRTGSVIKLAVNGTDSVSFDQVSNGVFAIEQFEFADGSVQGASWLTSRLPNVAPTATNLSAAETYTEDTALNLKDIVVTDTDSANTTVTLTLSNVAAGAFNTATSGAVTSTFNATTGVWSASGAVASVNTLLTGLTFTPKANFNGNFIVATSVTDGVAAAVTGSKAFTGTAVNDAPTGTVSVAGNLAQGQTLTASNTLADIDGLGTITYQWKAAGTAIAGATAATYVLAAAQVGKAITVTASFTDAKGKAESMTSVATATVLTSLVGTSVANTLTGTAAAEWISGLAGNDTLDGSAGADILVGGTGNDTYRLGRGYGADSIQENDATAGNTDVLQFLSGVATNQLWFTKVADDLQVSIIGTTDKVSIANWYLGNQYHVEQFKTSDGKTLLDSKVQNLVDAMAAFAPPAAGQLNLSASVATSLSPVLAASWL